MDADQLWQSLATAAQPLLTPTLEITLNDYHCRWQDYVALFYGACGALREQGA